MDAGLAVVFSAVVGVVGSVVVTLIQRSRRENKEDHGIVVDQQRVIYSAIVNVDNKLDRHIMDHNSQSTYSVTDL